MYSRMGKRVQCICGYHIILMTRDCLLNFFFFTLPKFFKSCSHVNAGNERKQWKAILWSLLRWAKLSVNLNVNISLALLIIALLYASDS